MSAIALAADELFDAAMGFVVGHLHGRMLGEISGGGMQHSANAAIECEFATADRVDGDAGGIRRILYAELHIDLHGHVAENSSFHANEGDFVIELPRHIIARSNV